MNNSTNNSNNSEIFHESRDTSMDKQLPKKSFVRKHRYSIIGGVLFLLFLIFMLTNLSGGKKQRIDKEKVIIGNVTEDHFLDYVDAEGIVQPILTIRLNTLETGIVKEIVAEEGAMLQRDGLILTLQNPELERVIDEQQDEWEKQRILYQEKKVEMEQKSILLQQQSLQARYELSRIKKDLQLGEEEFKMGVKSRAQLDVQQEEFDYRNKSTLLQLEGLKQDSAATLLRRELMDKELERARKSVVHARSRMDNLEVRAPVDGQLSFLNVTQGQRVGSSENIGEVKVMDNFKIHTNLSEYYIDHLTVGLPATVTYQGNKFALRVSKVVPEVKDRQFRVDLVFTDKQPDNLRIGKSYRVQIELGQPESAIVMPRGDFYQYTGGQWIYKLNETGDRAIRTSISIGRQNPVQYEIINGLEPGDRVIVNGYASFGDVDELIIR